jgi:folate-dependent phosphoribosylglycinamide formyltransferase PurN
MTMSPEKASETTKLVMVCSDGPSPRAVYNFLKQKFGDFPVVMEPSLSRLDMARRRVRKIGLFKVMGQIMFAAAVVPILQRSARNRIAEIYRDMGMEDEWGDAQITRVESINSDEARRVLTKMNPVVVVVNGTRIISSKTLECVNATFINTHAGITPLYRGVHGGYWALAEGRPELVGTTIHLVDSGIDTGSIIDQAFFNVTPEDNYATYPYLHTMAGLPLLASAVEAALVGTLATRVPGNELPSKLRFHPTIREYFSHRIRKGVK